MHKSVFCILLVVGVSASAALPAQQAYFTHAQNFAVPAQRPAAGGYASPLRWRPLESESTQEDSGNRGWTQNEGPSTYDYTDEPLGLPRGTYRRIEQRHTITPHSEGYRFRPIKPDEQQRNRARNENADQIHQGAMTVPQSAYQNGVQNHTQDRRGPEVLFRPDARLDSRSRGGPSRYDYPLGGSAPVFRPR